MAKRRKTVPEFLEVKRDVSLSKLSADETVYEGKTFPEAGDAKISRREVEIQAQIKPSRASARAQLYRDRASIIKEPRIFSRRAASCPSLLQGSTLQGQDIDDLFRRFRSHSLAKEQRIRARRGNVQSAMWERQFSIDSGDSEDDSYMTAFQNINGKVAAQHWLRKAAVPKKTSPIERTGISRVTSNQQVALLRSRQTVPYNSAAFSLSHVFKPVIRQTNWARNKSLLEKQAQTLKESRLNVQVKELGRKKRTSDGQSQVPIASGGNTLKKKLQKRRKSLTKRRVRTKEAAPKILQSSLKKKTCKPRRAQKPVVHFSLPNSSKSFGDSSGEQESESQYSTCVIEEKHGDIPEIESSVSLQQSVQGTSAHPVSYDSIDSSVDESFQIAYQKQLKKDVKSKNKGKTQVHKHKGEGEIGNILAKSPLMIKRDTQLLRKVQHKSTFENQPFVEKPSLKISHYVFHANSEHPEFCKKKIPMKKPERSFAQHLDKRAVFSKLGVPDDLLQSTSDYAFADTPSNPINSTIISSNSSGNLDKIFRF